MQGPDWSNILAWHYQLFRVKFGCNLESWIKEHVNTKTSDINKWTSQQATKETGKLQEHFTVFISVCWVRLSWTVIEKISIASASVYLRARAFEITLDL